MAQIRKATGFIDWLDQRLAVKKFMNVMMIKYWIPKQINFLWAMGVILTTLFAVLFVTGLLLVMYYKPDTALAFDSVNKTIMQEVEYGWLWRHLHGVAASVTFLIIYIHMLTGIYYGSYKKGREMIWISGMLLFVAFSAEAFSGYMLPWGQMSYWAAQVITQLFGGIPFIGDALVIWIRGDYAVSDPTLTRFFMLHVCLLPILIMAIIVLHFYSLRVPHVNNEIAEELDFELEAKKYEDGDTKARINSLYESGNYRAALDSITVLRDRYPAAIEARKAALVVWQNASLKMAQADVAQTDILLQQTIAKIASTTDRYERNLLGVRRDSLQARYDAMCGVVKMIRMRQKQEQKQ